MNDYLVIDVEAKDYTADGQTLPVLRDIRFGADRGEFVAVLGPSGCGKTTLIRLVLGLDTAYTGRIEVGGRQVAGPGLDRGAVFQEPRLMPWLSVRRNIEFAAPRGADRARTRTRAGELIDLVGLTGFERAWPRQLSGGMAQRVAVARALLNVPNLLALDEPFGALDGRTRTTLQAELARILQREGTTTLLVTHDIDEAVYLSDRVVVLTHRPTTSQVVLRVPLPRPRDRRSREFVALRSEVLEYLHGSD
jgi:sulfonate transport system ATP-binding protein